MKIVKEFRIDKIIRSRVINEPFKIVLNNGESFFTLNEKTCIRFGITMSMNLIGRILVCSFKSRELLLHKTNKQFFKGCVNMKNVTSDDLEICSLHKNERVISLLNTIPPSKHSEVSRIIKLSSFDNNVGIHPTPLPCPFYQINFKLTEKEYEACKALSPTSVMRMSFHLA